MRHAANTFDYHEFRTPESSTRLDRDADRGLQRHHARHAATRRAETRSARTAKGVVDPDFRVHGYRNLYVCDASVFPTSIGVNPQLTVMALADYAVSRVK